MSARYVGVAIAMFLLFTCWAHAETVQVLAEKANLRSQPRTDSTIVAPLTKGAVLDVVEKSDMWLRVKVRDTGAEGYIHSALVGAVAASGSSIPTPTPPPTVHPPATPEQPPASWAPVQSELDHGGPSHKVGVGVAGDPVLGGFAPSVQFSLSERLRAQGMFYLGGIPEVSFQLITLRGYYFPGEGFPRDFGWGAFAPYVGGGMLIWRLRIKTTEYTGFDFGDPTQLGFSAFGGSEIRFGANREFRVAAELDYYRTPDLSVSFLGDDLGVPFSLSSMGFAVQAHYFF